MSYGMQVIRDVLSPAVRNGQIWLETFDYNAVWDPFAASAINVPVQIPVDADADFLIEYSIMSAYSAPGTVILTPDYTVTFQDTGSGRYFQNVPTHVRNCFGTAERPYVWPEPKLIVAASVLGLQLTNRSTQQASVFAKLGGLKVFYIRGFTRAQLGLYGYGLAA